jgi:arylformamidase
MKQRTLNYDLMYNPRLTVSDVPSVLARWREASEQARAASQAWLDIPYGPSTPERLDLFTPGVHCRGMLVFFHGGYWRSLDKRDFSFIAPAFLDAGYAVAVVGYALCPTVRVRDIVMQSVQAAAWLHRNARHFGVPAGPLYFAGHSAGGHLATMLLACQWSQYAADLPAGLAGGALSISGVYDLRDIVRVPSINCDVHLDEGSAMEASPALMPPPRHGALVTAVGESENAGFHVQHELIARRWKAVVRASRSCPGDNHFTILDRFADPSSNLFHEATALLDGNYASA